MESRKVLLLKSHIRTEIQVQGCFLTLIHSYQIDETHGICQAI